ncbi:hypothetical protein [Flavobacterium sp.]|uniref:hypothetical protein n=1 Tax=Flavobacterium sp. TaxID=239 RepID=UPI0011FA782B|nr:hypothetical protein [Flavobacterium sp.]RZJ70951.1 MAG: hypothetical protein EOO49_12500 [Flavobacterium sp.]
MKKCTFLMVMMASVFSVNSFAQGNGAPIKIGITRLVSGTFAGGSDENIVGYRVEERINLNFGGRVTTYIVSNLSMVSKVDLGPNNSRKITPIYGKVKAKATPKVAEAISMMAKPAVATAPASSTNEIAKVETPISALTLAPATLTVAKPVEVVKAERKVTSVNIDLIDTYERTLEKGYESVDMLKRVANARFFDGHLEAAAKWYGHYFRLAKEEIEPVMYFRYSQCLKATNQNAKAAEMMKIYEAKSK